MVEFGDHLVEEVYEVDAGLKVLELGLVEIGLVLDDAEVLEAIHVQGLVVGVEFLKVLLAGCVAGEEIDGPLAPGLEFGNTGTGLVLGGATDRFVAHTFQIAFCDLAEGDEVQALVELGKEDITVVAQEAGAQAQFS